MKLKEKKKVSTIICDENDKQVFFCLDFEDWDEGWADCFWLLLGGDAAGSLSNDNDESLSLPVPFGEGCGFVDTM